MLDALRSIQSATCNAAGVPLSFDNDDAAIAAATGSVALYDASHWGRIRVSDADRLNFLHNQSTNDLKNRQPGEGCDTVFVTSTARTIDLATAYILDDAVLLNVSPGSAPELIKVLDRYIFFSDKVKLQDISTATVAFQLMGPASQTIVEQLGASQLISQPYGTHAEITIADMTIRIAVGGNLNRDDYTIIANATDAAPLWETLTTHGAVPCGETAWEELRIRQGRPMPGNELTDAFNPLEAGLWHTISFDKGCYIGQETIARLETYNGVKQQLWGFHSDQPVEIGTTITIDGSKVGQVTSIRSSSDGYIGLAYIKTKAGGAGLAVTIGEIQTTLADLPYLTRAKQV
ncbi:folate-binding protein YgfZ [filamentous cyanobacterium LEGE 11480]|uniref:Folate-binding protein YgfZ n=1 Tax=Romeriopsis navalis LEGE 11480 TaxID=2777977 RepID=A0A928VIZ5_9CYAN|nr:folate-binding protein [Romeriopsis navalis]MBE9029205.1 folate-binding protein YgfZ [Romeriopsis navalis LEGE 11480]